MRIAPVESVLSALTIGVISEGDTEVSSNVGLKAQRLFGTTRTRIGPLRAFGAHVFVRPGRETCDRLLVE